MRYVAQEVISEEFRGNWACMVTDTAGYDLWNSMLPSTMLPSGTGATL